MGHFSVALNLSLKLPWLPRIRWEFPVQPFLVHLTGNYLDSKETSIMVGRVKTGKIDVSARKLIHIERNLYASNGIRLAVTNDLYVT